MPDYSKSVIYKIYDNTNGDTYYGSTCNELRYRMQGHKKDAKRNHRCKSIKIILNDDYTYSVVEKFPCETKQELHVRERWYIENNPCINKVIPGRTSQEYNLDNYETISKQHAERYIVNKDTIRARQKKHYEDNKEYYSNRHAEYRKVNSEEIKKKADANKVEKYEKSKVLIRCECGLEIAKRYIKKHRLTPKHAKLLVLLCPPCPPQPSPP